MEKKNGHKKFLVGREVKESALDKKFFVGREVKESARDPRWPRGKRKRPGKVPRWPRGKIKRPREGILVGREVKERVKWDPRWLRGKRMCQMGSSLAAR